MLPAYAGLDLAQVSVVASSAQAAAARAVLEQADALGFDTESRPTFIRGQLSSGPHLVQLSTDSHCYLYQVDHLDGLDDLNALLASPRLIKAGFGLGDDRKRIAAKLGVEPADVLELNTVFRERGYRKDMGVKGAVAVLFNRRYIKSKKASTSNWANPQLTPAQLIYAANDAWAAIRVYDGLGL